MTKQTNKKINKGRVFREKNILKQFKELNDEDQKNVYGLIWSLGAKDLLYRVAKERSKYNKETQND